VWELAKGISALKVITLILNIAIVVYLLLAKRLFGLRGGGKAERAEHDADTGWAAIEAATPGLARQDATPRSDPAASPL
jgi:hypothetical protein